MSRPFSYNDENFTVIDNLLFVHFNDISERKAYEPVIQVPDEIFKRMASYGNIVTISGTSSSYVGFNAGICIINRDNKHYIAFSDNRSSSSFNRYHYCFYFLKDI